MSALSVAWTVLSSGLAIWIGIRDDTGVLVAFGAIGVVDAVGSVALVRHFRHGLRHDELSDDLERVAHRVVLVGLGLVGCAAVVGGLFRLSTGGASDSSNAGVALAVVSFVALVGLSARKLQIGRRVESAALLSDGHLSAVGACLAAVTVAGTMLTRWLGWHWADAVATMLVGAAAVWLSRSTWRSEHARTEQSRGLRSLIGVAIGWMAAVTVLDGLLGSRLVLVGLLVGGPAVAAGSGKPRAVSAVSALAVLLALLLGWPDHMWMSSSHWIWISAVALVGVSASLLVAITAPLMGRHER